MKALRWNTNYLHLFLLNTFAVIEIFDSPLSFWVYFHGVFSSSKDDDAWPCSCSLCTWVFMMESGIPDIRLVWNVNFDNRFSGSCMCLTSNYQDLIWIWRCDETILYSAMNFKLSNFIITGNISHCCVSRSSTYIFLDFLVLLLRPPKT